MLRAFIGIGSLLVLAAGMLAGVGVASAAPGNDSFEGRQLLPVGTPVAFDTGGAVLDTDEAAIASQYGVEFPDAAVWFQLPSEVSGAYGFRSTDQVNGDGYVVALIVIGSPGSFKVIGQSWNELSLPTGSTAYLVLFSPDYRDCSRLDPPDPECVDPNIPSETGSVQVEVLEEPRVPDTSLDVKVPERVDVDAQGRPHVEWSYRCEDLDVLDVTFELGQRNGRGLTGATGWDLHRVPICDGASHQVLTELEVIRWGSFGPGNAELTVDARGRTCSDYCDELEHQMYTAKVHVTTPSGLPTVLFNGDATPVNDYRGLTAPVVLLDNPATGAHFTLNPTVELQSDGMVALSGTYRCTPGPTPETGGQVRSTQGGVIQLTGGPAGGVGMVVANFANGPVAGVVFAKTCDGTTRPWKATSSRISVGESFKPGDVRILNTEISPNFSATPIRVSAHMTLCERNKRNCPK